MTFNYFPRITARHLHFEAGTPEMETLDRFFASSQAKCAFCDLTDTAIMEKHNAKRLTPKGKLKKNAPAEMDLETAKNKLIYHIIETHYSEGSWLPYVEYPIGSEASYQIMEERRKTREEVDRKISVVTKAFYIELDPRYKTTYALDGGLAVAHFSATGYCGRLNGQVRLNMLYDAATLNVKDSYSDKLTTTKQKADFALLRMQSLLMEDADFWAGNGVYRMTPVHGETGEFWSEEELSA